MRKLLFFMLTMITVNAALAQDTLKLWTGKIPYSNGIIGTEEFTDQGHVRNIQDPTITVYLPHDSINTGAAVVICPGGGYWLLAIKHEGHDVAKWLNKIGVAGIVVKNRLPTSDNITDTSEVALADAQRAVRMTRYHAAEWGIDPAKIGIMGFSAGGHLASTAGTHFDRGQAESPDSVQKVSSRPDFMILMYPVISMSEPFMHSGSAKNLIGENPSEEQKLRFSNEKQVTADTPPTILIHSSDDKGVPVANSIVFYQALNAHGVSAELHIYNSGGHGFGLGKNDGTSHNLWTQTCEAWLKDMVFNK